MNKKIKIAFYNEKNQVGKSTLTLLIGAHIKQKFKENIVIIDTSDNKTLYEKRSIENKKFSKLETFSLHQKDIIPIHSIDSFEEWKNLKKKIIEDVVLFDINGYGEEQIKYLLNVDYLFIISNSELKSKEFKLDVELLEMFRKIRLKNIPLKEIYLILNENKEKETIIKNVLVPFIPKANKLKNLTTLQRKSTGEVATISDQVFQIYKQQEKVIYE